MADQVLDNHLQKVKSVLSREPQVVAGYLFGSRAKGYARAGSDLDIAVLTKPEFKPKGYYYQAKLGEKLQEAVKGVKVEPVLVEDMPLPLKYSSVVEGQLIYSRDDRLRAAEEVKIAYQYEDMADYYDLAYRSGVKASLASPARQERYD